MLEQTLKNHLPKVIYNQFLLSSSSTKVAKLKKKTYLHLPGQLYPQSGQCVEAEAVNVPLLSGRKYYCAFVCVIECLTERPLETQLGVLNPRV